MTQELLRSPQFGTSNPESLLNATSQIIDAALSAAHLHSSVGVEEKSRCVAYAGLKRCIMIMMATTSTFKFCGTQFNSYLFWVQVLDKILRARASPGGFPPSYFLLYLYSSESSHQAVVMNRSLRDVTYFVSGILDLPTSI